MKPGMHRGKRGCDVTDGYSRPELLTTSVLNDESAGAREPRTVASGSGQSTLRGTTTITTHAGDGLAVHAAAVAAVLPGVHVAAFAAA